MHWRTYFLSFTIIIRRVRSVTVACWRLPIRCRHAHRRIYLSHRIGHNRTAALLLPCMESCLYALLYTLRSLFSSWTTLIYGSNSITVMYRGSFIGFGVDMHWAIYTLASLLSCIVYYCHVLRVVYTLYCRHALWYYTWGTKRHIQGQFYFCLFAAQYTCTQKRTPELKYGPVGGLLWNSHTRRAALYPL